MTKTPNFSFELVTFDKSPWGQLINDNWSVVDAVMARFIAINKVKGVWQLATAVAVDDVYIDNTDGTLWKVLVAHTTASSGTFSADRTKTSTNWESFTVSITFKGTWKTATAYSPNQFVVDSNRYGVVVTSYTSGASYNADVTNGDIATLVDLSTDLAAAALSATNAAASATSAAASAAGVNLPAIVALNFLRGLSDASGYELRTPAQVLSDIGAEASDPTLTALAGLTVAANELIYATGADAFAVSSLTAAARTLLDDATVAAMRTTLGLVIGTDVLSPTGDGTSLTGIQADLAVPSQAEAEAGTATTERVWTAQRVKQAIAALETSSSITLGTEQATTSGTAFTFTGIPAGTKRIVMTLEGVSLNGTNNLLVQIGDAGGIETSGYVSTTVLAANAATTIGAGSTAGFVLDAGAATNVVSGQIVLCLSDATNFTWIASHSMKVNTTGASFGGGNKSLSAELTQVRLTRTSADVFDAGAVNIQYQS